MSDVNISRPPHLFIVEDADENEFLSTAELKAFAKNGEQVDPAAAAFYDDEFMLDDEIEWDGAVPKGAD